MCEEARNVAVERRQAREGEMQTMKHIDEFTIHAFRGLRDVKLEGLGQINLLVGENNSGKTSVLEALAIFCNPFDRLQWRNVLSMREMSNPRSSLGSRERFREQLHKIFNWLISACIQNNVQLFATTHSLETVDAVINASRDETIDLVAYRLELYKGQKTVTRLDKPLLTRLRANLGMEVR
jgi:AAA15 family ATPase/GTPase